MTASGAGTVRALAAYETTRLTSLRSARVTAVLLALWALLNGVGTGLTPRVTGDRIGKVDVELALLGLPVLTAFTPVLAAVALLYASGSITQELRSGSVRWLLVARPDRRAVLLVKGGVTALAVLLAAGAFALLSGASLFLADPAGFPLGAAELRSVGETLLAYAAVLVLWAALGVGLAGVLSSRGRTLGAAVGWAVVAEPLLGHLAGRLDVEAWTAVVTPFTQSRRLLGPVLDLSGTGTVDWLPALPCLALTTTCVLLAGLRRFARRGL